MITEVLPYRPKKPLAPHGHHSQLTCEMGLPGEDLAGMQGFESGGDVIQALRRTAAGVRVSEELAQAIDVLIGHGCNVSLREFVHAPLVDDKYLGDR